MGQVLDAFATPHGQVELWLWGVSVLLVLLALHQLLRRTPSRSDTRSEAHARWAAVSLPLAVAAGLVAAGVAGEVRGPTFTAVMWLRWACFWVAVTVAPTAIGQVVGLRPPRWVGRVHLGLAAAFLLGTATTDLVVQRLEAFDPTVQFGPLATVLLIPVAATAGWWLLSCLPAVPGRVAPFVFALGGSGTALALVVASLVIDPALADHLLTVAFLPVLAASELLQLRRT